MGSSKPRIIDLRGGREVRPPQRREDRPIKERRSTLRERRKRTRAVITAAVCVCALLTAYAVHAASYLPRFTYQHVAVSGSPVVPPGQIETFVENRLAASSRGYISGRNIFLYDLAPLENEIVNNFPRVRAAHVSRDTSLGNGLSVSIEERTPFALWCNGATCYMLDQTGIVFVEGDASATSTLPTPYVFSGTLATSSIQAEIPPLGSVYAPNHFSGITDFLKKLTDAGLHPQGAKIESDADFSIPLAEGFYLKASFGSDPVQLSKNLALILAADALKDKSALLEYIDLRFGNRVYYKLKGQAQTQ